MEEHQNVRLSTCPSELNHSYYTGNSFSALQSSMVTRPPRLCIHWSPPRRLTTLRPHARRLAHSYYMVTSDHLFLRAPLATSQVKHAALIPGVRTALQPLSCSSSADSASSPHFTPGRCRADDPTQYSFLERFNADGFSLCFLVLC